MGGIFVPSLIPICSQCPPFLPPPLLTVPLRAAKVVTSVDDSGPGTLREALTTAVAGEGISFGPGITGAASQQVITLATPLLWTKDQTLSGPGVRKLRIVAPVEQRHWSVGIGKACSFTNLTLEGPGAGQLGGAS
jgi:hypothetical protein